MFSIIEWEHQEDKEGEAAMYVLYQKKYFLGKSLLSGWAVLVRKYEESPIVIFDVGGSVLWTNPGLAAWPALPGLIEAARNRLEW